MLNNKELRVYADDGSSFAICTNIQELKEIIKTIKDELCINDDIEACFAVTDKSFIDGKENPCKCNLNPETHKHYLFVWKK